MSELEMKTEVETEDFSAELSDESLDRVEGFTFTRRHCEGVFTSLR